MAITPGGRVGDASPLAKPGNHGPRRLDDYVRMVAHALMREHGYSKSHAIAAARNALKRWSAGGGKVRPQVRAGAAGALAHQAALDARPRGRHNLAAPAGRTLDLAVAEALNRDLDLGWREALHPRDAVGRFRSAGARAARLRRHYEVTGGGHRRTVEYKGNEIGAATLRGDGKWVTGHTEHDTAHAATKRIIDEHIATMLLTKRRNRPHRHDDEGGGLLNRFVQAGGLYGGTASQFATELADATRLLDLAVAEAINRDIDLIGDGHGHHIPGTPYVYSHGWRPLHGAPIPAQTRKAVIRAARQGNKRLAADVLTGKAPHTAVRPQRAHTGRFAAEVTPRQLKDTPRLQARYEAHVKRADDLLNSIFKGGAGPRPTDETHARKVPVLDEHGNPVLKDGKPVTRLEWNTERSKVHKRLVRNVLRRQVRQGAKAERKALFLGGLPGAGKTRSLDKIPGLREQDYVTINPDIFKEELARAGLVPKVPGLSPMEASALNHEESSEMALMLAREARKRGLNIVWDITMNKASSVESRLAPLREAGYSANAVFVDIPHELSVKRVLRRHQGGWKAQQADRTGRHLGERLVPSSHVGSGKSTKGSSSANRDAFEEVKNKFDAYKLYNNFNGNENEFPLEETDSGGVFRV